MCPPPSKHIVHHAEPKPGARCSSITELTEPLTTGPGTPAQHRWHEPLPQGPVWFLFFPHPVHVWSLPLNPAPMWSPRDPGPLIEHTWDLRPPGRSNQFSTKCGRKKHQAWNHELLCGGSEIQSLRSCPCSGCRPERGLHTHAHTHIHTCILPMVLLFYSTAADN